ncbi:galactoside 2-alpha-L-fucosyltransferase-like [Panicum miliaceum]|uniref:Fucosyltransferase n=1 Tax=Panicum miliaceum TaxID=4540 RepID=A0A3L6S0K3_PANMI|nr:galactoside 2-alpha-L-fucosyltransferase-like [Panicum miliaceum]
MVRNNVIRAGGGNVNVSLAQTPAFAYVYLHSDASAHDKSFFCDEDHRRLLRRFQRLRELDAMFPEPDVVFHHLGRYFFHPNIHVWGLITRYYAAYLAGAAQRVGIQVRIFGAAQPDSTELLEQITSCTQKHKLLLEVLATGEPMPPAIRAKSTKAVLVTSFKPWYHQQLKSMYWEHAAANGGVSTFGYVTQGLAGLRLWVMYKSKPRDDGVVPNPQCGRAASMEPCFFTARNYNLWKKQWLNTTGRRVHHLGRYLFHPNNHVWGLVTCYHDTYLSGAAQRVGIQVRVFGAQLDSTELLEQITSCTQKHKLLLEVLAMGESMPPATRAKSTKAVLVTSLKPWYHEQLKSMYLEHAAAIGEVVSMHLPSHEGYQRFGIESHNRKAWAEIYLLSLADVLVTTSQSTFGYVAQGLAGLRPWVMYKPAGDGTTTVPDPPCGRTASMEPCFFAAPNYNL